MVFIKPSIKEQTFSATFIPTSMAAFIITLISHINSLYSSAVAFKLIIDAFTAFIRSVEKTFVVAFELVQQIDSGIHHQEG